MVSNKMANLIVKNYIDMYCTVNVRYTVVMHGTCIKPIPMPAPPTAATLDLEINQIHCTLKIILKSQ